MRPFLVLALLGCHAAENAAGGDDAEEYVFGAYYYTGEYYWDNGENGEDEFEFDAEYENALNEADKAADELAISEILSLMDGNPMARTLLGERGKYKKPKPVKKPAKKPYKKPTKKPTKKPVKKPAKKPDKYGGNSGGNNAGNAYGGGNSGGGNSGNKYNGGSGGNKYKPPKKNCSKENATGKGSPAVCMARRSAFGTRRISALAT